MTFSSTKSFGVLTAVVSVVALCGCGARTYNKRHYILEAARPAPLAETRSDAVLEVRRFTIDAAFANKGLVYRLDEFAYEPDFYQEFLVAPAIMITAKTRLWLAQSGLFQRVLTLGSRLEPTYTLEGDITALYGDFRDEAAPKAVMELHCFLLSDADPGRAVVFGKVYEASSPLQSTTADVLVEALNNCLVDILERLEADLQESVEGDST
jgi:ABC-type uncharacterized transport system auxiliary subunit